MRRGLAELAIDLDAARQRQLLDYLDLLMRWNSAYNLTAVRDRDAAITRHLLDSLSLLPELQGKRVIDVGTGAGLPGIPLAVASPQRRFCLLDSNGKKTRFLFQVVTTLGLENCEVVRERVEAYRPEQRFDVVVSRAFAALDDMIRSCGHLLAPRGVMLAMKGQLPDQELAVARPLADVMAVQTLRVPGLDEERCVVRLGFPANSP